MHGLIEMQTVVLLVFLVGRQELVEMLEIRSSQRFSELLVTCGQHLTID